MATHQLGLGIALGLLVGGCSSSGQPTASDPPAGGSSSGTSGAPGLGGNVASDASSAGQPNVDPTDAAAPNTTCGEPLTNDSVGNDCYDTAPPPLTLTPILNAGYIFAPMMLASPPGDASRLFVITRGGTVLIIKDGVLLPDPFLDLTGIVSANNGEAEH
ncbi:MAG TPA: hypothetical protein VHO25_19870, partial [Polyangiaceae bacterium]|nr:hypothetical protein [Polyangiaceae bacterium]